MHRLTLVIPSCLVPVVLALALTACVASPAPGAASGTASPASAGAAAGGTCEGGCTKLITCQFIREDARAECVDGCRRDGHGAADLADLERGSCDQALQWVAARYPDAAPAQQPAAAPPAGSGRGGKVAGMACVGGENCGFGNVCCAGSDNARHGQSGTCLAAAICFMPTR
jgi:hypothetical protein